MTGAVSSSRASGVSSVRLGGPGGKGAAASTAMNGIAANVAALITAELKLAVDPDGRRKAFVAAHDLYDVEETATEMTQALGGAPADRGRATLSLQRFAQEVAALLAARPESRSLEHVARAIATADHSPASDVLAALRAIDGVSDAISGKVTGGASP
jgi:hypothetical protein